MPASDILQLLRRKTEAAARLAPGPTGPLISLESLAGEFDCTTAEARTFLASLGVPLITIPGLERAYFSQASFEMALFLKLLPSSWDQELQSYPAEVRGPTLSQWVLDMALAYGVPEKIELDRRLRLIGDHLLSRPAGYPKGRPRGPRKET